jgi:hypothetical protein
MGSELRQDTEQSLSNLTSVAPVPVAEQNALAASRLRRWVAMAIFPAPQA